MKAIIAGLLSALLIWIAPQAPSPTQIHKQESAHPMAVAKTQVRPTHPQPEKTASEPVIQAAQPQVTTFASGCSTYDSIFRQYAWNVRIAEAICEAESSGNPYATSSPNYDGLRDYGLMQIHGEAIYDPSANIARAHQKYLTQGWGAWTSYNTDAYISYL